MGPAPAPAPTNTAFASTTTAPATTTSTIPVSVARIAIAASSYACSANATCYTYSVEGTGLQPGTQSMYHDSTECVGGCDGVVVDAGGFIMHSLNSECDQLRWAHFYYTALDLQGNTIRSNTENPVC